MIKQLWNTILKYADQISTRPNTTSWKWKGSVSILAYIVLYTMYVARLLSLLQHCKFWYRTLRQIKRKSYSVDKASKRINIPPMFVEIYFLAWCIILFILPPEWRSSKIAAYYFMGESIFWLLYYFFFRRFFEEKYAIMHALEYIVLLPILIISQVKCFSIVYHIPLQKALATLFFPTTEQSPYIIVLSVLYTAVIFGIFLSNLPIEQVKERGNYQYNISIIGNGQIVQNRLKQAIAQTNKQWRIAIFDLYPYEKRHEQIKHASFHYFEINDDSLKNVLSSNVLWIASPPFAHFEYLNRYINQVFVVIEKPLTTNSMELQAIKQLRNSGLWQNVFCLSYYYLEKALPLTFLYNPYTFYEKYINFNGKNRNEILSLFTKLGRLNSVEIVINESKDERIWLKNEVNGGHLYETFIHMIVLAKMATMHNGQWQTTHFKTENINDFIASKIDYLGMTQDGLIPIHLTMDKWSQPNQLKRYCLLKYEHGEISINFDNSNLIAHSYSENYNFQLSLKEEYLATKYGVQLDMVERCFSENIHPCMIDGVDLQIASLEWLFAQNI